MTYRARASPKHKNPRGGIPPGLIGLRRHGHPGRSVVVPVKVVVPSVAAEFPVPVSGVVSVAVSEIIFRMLRCNHIMT